MVHHMPITKARINLGQLAKRAHINNDYFILEKDGIPVLGLMSADELEDYLEVKNPEVNKIIAKSKTDIKSGKTHPASDLLKNLNSPRGQSRK